MSTEDLLAQLVQMRKAVNEETLLRFKSVRRLTTEVTAEWIQFQICISLRPEGAPLWSTLNQWIGQASWHMLGCRLRRGSASLRQSNPANLESDVSVIPSLKALLQLVLHNPTNLCYLHSTIMAVHWACCRSDFTMPELLCHHRYLPSCAHLALVQHPILVLSRFAIVAMATHVARLATTTSAT